MDKKNTLINHWGKQKTDQADLDKLDGEELKAERHMRKNLQEMKIK